MAASSPSLVELVGTSGAEDLAALILLETSELTTKQLAEFRGVVPRQARYWLARARRQAAGSYEPAKEAACPLALSIATQAEAALAGMNPLSAAGRLRMAAIVRYVARRLTKRTGNDSLDAHEPHVWRRALGSRGWTRPFASVGDKGRIYGPIYRFFSMVQALPEGAESLRVEFGRDIDEMLPPRELRPREFLQLQEGGGANWPAIERCIQNWTAGHIRPELLAGRQRKSPRPPIEHPWLPNGAMYFGYFAGIENVQAGFAGRMSNFLAHESTAWEAALLAQSALALVASVLEPHTETSSSGVKGGRRRAEWPVGFARTRIRRETWPAVRQLHAAVLYSQPVDDFFAELPEPWP